MFICDNPGAEQRTVISGIVRVTPKYTIKFKLCELDGVYTSEVIWDPHPPSSTKHRALARKLDAALMPCLTEIPELGILPDRSGV